MLNCDSSEELIVEHLYDSLGAREAAELEEHLKSCAQCQSLAQEMQAAKSALDASGLHGNSYDDIPERARLDSMWERLEPELDRVDAERFRQMNERRLTPYIAAAMAIAASVVVFFSVLPLDEQPDAPRAEIATTPQISPELMSYLSRAESMLLLVANAESRDSSAMPVASTFARDMAYEASYLNTNMEDSFNSGQARLLRDIEFLLMQVANLDESNMEAGINLLQQYLEDNSVLFKIRLLEMRDRDAVI